MSGHEREVLVLVGERHLRGRARAAVDTEALALDRRAYRVRRDLYGRTPPAERVPG